jgi:radical SAM superfamily enzyme YgiQ (UPF0313 family)
MPLGLSYVASYLESRGHEVRCVDMEAEDDPWSRIDDAMSAGVKLVGTTATTQVAGEAIATLREIKKRYGSDVRTVLGGHHATHEPHETAGQPGVDVVVVGDGEEIMNSIADGKQLDGIEGIVYREGALARTKDSRAVTWDLDTIPFPAYNHFPMDRYKPSPHRNLGYDGPYATMVTGRGCPHACQFCSGSLTPVRRRSVDNVVDELRFLERSFGAGAAMFYDDTFTLDRSWVEEFAKRLNDGGPDFVWGCNTRLDSVDPELLCTMRDAGCRRIYVGVESGNEAVRNGAGKRISNQTVRDGIHMIKDAGMGVSASFVLGLPGDTRRTMDETITFARGLGVDFAQFYAFTPDPGSPAYRRLKAAGIINPMEWMNYHDMIRKGAALLGEKMEFDDVMDKLKEATS